MNALIIIVIICMFHSTYALFHHHFSVPQHHHTRIQVCLTPPNTIFKVQKHIKECQHEVKTNVFNEAFSLIHEKLPHNIHDDAHWHELHDDPATGDFAHHNFTLTEHEILKFFEDHVHDYLGLHSHVTPTTHLHSTHLHPAHVHSAHVHSAHLHPTHAPHIHPVAHTSSLKGSHLESGVEYLHPESLASTKLHIIESTPHFKPLQPIQPLHVSKPHVYTWNPLLERLHKKTDALQGKRPVSSAGFPLPSAGTPVITLTPKRNPYAYFDVNTGEPIRRIGRRRRDASDYHPTTATFKDRRIAGCLMHCLYTKDNVIDTHTGYPTLDGLVNFYSDGVHEHGFFMTTLRAVDFCLKSASIKYHINRHVKPAANISCDLAFDIFDCVSDKITEYCSTHHYHDAHGELNEHKSHLLEKFHHLLGHKPEVHIKPEIHHDHTDEHHYYYYK